MLQSENNKITLCGTVLGEPKFNHEVFGEKFYSFTLCVKRLSGQTDELPIMLSERLMYDIDISDGKRLKIEGQIRSYNIMVENKSRLQIETFAREIFEYEGDDINSIYIEGFVCKTPVYRVTPFSREIADLLVAVNRAYGKSDYIPAICWGRNARYCQKISVGDPIVIEGRLQSREYQKRIDEETVITRTAYEVSVSKFAVKAQLEDKAE